MKNLLEFVSKGRSNDFVENVNKTLAKKLLRAISEQASDVARQTYGTLEEYYGGDEQPDYVNNEDNAYATFFANALKKFGVQGPEDFKDDVTKQRFFDYVDHNWRAQDSVQSPIQGANGGGMENGTQTQLPAPAALPQAPAAPTTQPSPTTAQGNDPSLATMAPAGPTTNQISPMGTQGSDPTLNGAQNQQTFGGQGPVGGAPTPPAGAPGAQGNACPYCKGSGLAACPTCGRAHGLENQQQGGGMGGDEIGDNDDDIQSRLHIGPEGSDDDFAETGEEGGDEGLEGGEQDPNGENIDGGMDDGMGQDPNADPNAMGGDEEGMEGDEMGQDPNADPNAMGDDQQQVPGAPGEEEDVDDPFDDEDAFTIDASDFDGAGGNGGDEEGMEGDDEGEVDENGNPIEGDDEDLGDENGLDSEGGDDQQGGFGGNEEGDEDEDQDVDGQDDGEESFGGDAGQDEGDGDEEEDEDPDLEVGDDDTADEDDDEEAGPPRKVVGEALKHRSYSRKERKQDGKKPERAAGKKEAKLAEDFGFGLDNAEDDVFLAEALMMQAQAAPVDPGLNKIISYVQQQLSKIKKLRNTMLMQLRRQRAVIKKDPAIDGEEKMAAMKQLAQMAKDNRKFFKTQAKLVKAMFTGKLAGEDVEAPEGDEGMDQGQEGMDQGQAPQQGGFPPKKQGGFPPAGDDEEGGEELEDGDEDMGAEEGDEGGEEQGGFPPKKKTPFPPKKKAGFPPAAQGDDEGDDEEPEESDDNEEVEEAEQMPTFDALKREREKKFGQARTMPNFAKLKQQKGVTENEGSMAAIESKIKMLHMQIKSQGDPGGRRRAALKSLEGQLKTRR